MALDMISVHCTVLPPLSPPQHPIIDCLADMPCFDPFASVEIGDSAGDGQNPIAGIGVQGQFSHGHLEQVAAVVAYSSNDSKPVLALICCRISAKPVPGDRISRSGGHIISILMSACGSFRRCPSICL